jgi:cytoskeletal protein RodZ
MKQLMKLHGFFSFLLKQIAHFLFLIFQSEPVVVKPNEAGERLDDLIKSLQKVSSATPTTLSKSSSSSSSSAAVSSTSSSFKPQPLQSGGAAEAAAMVNHMQVIWVVEFPRERYRIRNVFG